MARNFQVDLRGIVDLLSHNLYSTPGVYVRELLQNAVDAVTARALTDQAAPSPIALSVEDGIITVSDSGIGLTRDQVEQLLATIGRTSKRDELGLARHEFLGQFGIGLLSAFLVADEVEVVTRALGESAAVRWVGHADGTYDLGDAQRGEVGTTVTLRVRPDASDWIEPHTVVELAARYGSMLPYTVTVNGQVVSGSGLIWELDNANLQRAEVVGFAQDTFGFTPFDVIDLGVATAELTGVAYVLPYPANPAQRPAHHVYVKQMLLSQQAAELLPEWAFFVRCVVNSDGLRPTASRESLFEDSLLREAREAIGSTLRSWLVALARTNPDRFVRFLEIHHLGIQALALFDNDMLRLIYDWRPVETNVGHMPLAEIVERFGTVRYAATTDEFRQVAAVAAAQNIVVVNGGYTYLSEIVERLPELDATITIERLEPTDLTTAFTWLSADDELSIRPFIDGAQRVLDDLGCEVVVRSFEPSALPVVYLFDRDWEYQNQIRATRGKVDDFWAGVLSEFDRPTQKRPQLVLNWSNPMVRRVAGLTDNDRRSLAVETLYGQALLLGHHPIRPADSVVVNRSMLGLFNQAFGELGE